MTRTTLIVTMPIPTRGHPLSTGPGTSELTEFMGELTISYVVGD